MKKRKNVHSIIINKTGQSFIEFLFLFFTLIILSFVMLKATNTGVAERWITLVAKIVSTDPKNPTRPTLR